MSTDRIEKSIVLRAIATAGEFGNWFGAKFEGEFTPGARVTGRITIPGYEHLNLEMTIERIDPERLFSYRWHPYAIEPNVDYGKEPTTLVEFRLEEVTAGTRLTVTESGFDRIPAVRRADAFRMNDEGWTGQMKNIERHVTS